MRLLVNEVPEDRQGGIFVLSLHRAISDGSRLPRKPCPKELAEAGHGNVRLVGPYGGCQRLLGSSQTPNTPLMPSDPCQHVSDRASELLNSD